MKEEERGRRGGESLEEERGRRGEESLEERE